MDENTKRNIILIDRLLKLSSENGCTEFKQRKGDAVKIGQTISALANTAMLEEQQEAYILFGIEDKTHEVVGTKFDPWNEKARGNEDMIPWLTRLLDPKIDFQFEKIQYENQNLVLLTIRPNLCGPVSFDGERYIRIDKTNKNLKSFKEKERILFERMSCFELRKAKEIHHDQDVLELLDYDHFFEITNTNRNTNLSYIIEKFLERQYLCREKGRLYITNLGAILFAREIENFPKLKFKAPKVITYSSNNNLEKIDELSAKRGYARFNGLLNYVMNRVPLKETIEGGLRKETRSIPRIVVREILANALIHQDFSINGSGPTIEIFQDRIEIFNPGKSLIEVNRFMDHESSCRNELLADSMRTLNICEKRGSGIDRAFDDVEKYKIPAPKFENRESGVLVTIYSKRKLADMNQEMKRAACYWHSCYMYIVKRTPMTNSSLRKRMNINEKNKSIASRIIKDSLSRDLIKRFDPENKAPRHYKYIPEWVQLT